MDNHIRLREERERLGLSQTELGEAGGVRKQAQHLYETGARQPDMAYLSAIATAGADVLYILTGRRSQAVAEVDLLPDGDRTLLDNFHAAPAQVQAGIKTTLGAFADATGHVAKGRKRAA